MGMKRRLAIVAALCALVALAMGCADPSRPSAGNPVTLTLWHTYVEQMNSGIGSLIDEFNGGVGAENGITVSVTSVSNASVLNQNILTAANSNPGAPKLPDIALVYPHIAKPLAEKGMLTDLRAQFSDGDLLKFVPRFLQEGMLGGEEIYLLPVAKSTEVLYVNRVIFDRFAAATGVDLAELGTFEGIAGAAEMYADWTDALTPAVSGDAKAFFYPDNLFNYALIGLAQMGENLIAGGAIDPTVPGFRRVWESYYPQAVRGHFAIFNDYGNYLAKTGDIVCTTSTSAGVMFYPDSVTYSDNTKEEAWFDVLPYPVFEGGKKIAMQRGGGMCVFRSTPAKEAAAGLFLAWLTAPEQNLRFTANTGYLPVTTEAFERLLAQGNAGASDQKVQALLDTVLAMQREYEFYVPELFPDSEASQRRFGDRLRASAERAGREYKGLLSTTGPAEAYEKASRGAFEEFAQK